MTRFHQIGKIMIEMDLEVEKHQLSEITNLIQVQNKIESQETET